MNGESKTNLTRLNTTQNKATQSFLRDKTEIIKTDYFFPPNAINP